MSESFIPNGEFSSGFSNASVPPIVMHTNGGGEGTGENIGTTPWYGQFNFQNIMDNFKERAGQQWEELYHIPLSNGMTLGEKATDRVGHILTDEYNMFGKKINLFPIAGPLLQNARHNLEFTEKNEHSHIINSLSDIKNKGLRGLLNKVNVPKDSRGVFYDVNSVQSKKLFNSPEIQKYIADNYSKLKANQNNPNFLVRFNNKDDNHLGLGQCTLHNPRITPDGYFRGIIVDYYNFEYLPGDDPITKVNNWGYALQEKGMIEKHFVIYQIREKL